jgi:hypothetical protein
MEKYIDNVFVAVYTNKVKSYCDVDFFNALQNNISTEHIYIVDNTNDNGRYAEQLKNIINCNIINLDIPEEPQNTKFHRKVAESVLYLRSMFLESNYKYFLIAESDVILPPNTIATLIENIETMPEDTGAVGALYYEGFHDYNRTGIHYTNHVLSGCTLYKRSMIEKYPFRYQEDYLQAFPDALICIDAINEYKYYNNHDIKCKHAHTSSGSRYV